jgi:hypothetical protein
VLGAAARRRGPSVVLAAKIGLAALGAPLPSAAVTLVDDATLVAGSSTPVSREFAIEEAGRFELRLADARFPAALAGLQAVITTGNRNVVVIRGPGTVEFDASPGVHELQVAGIASAAAGVGSFAAQIVSAGSGAVVLDVADSIETPGVPPPQGQSTLQTRVEIVEAGRYRIALTDLAFPESLASVELLLTRGGEQVARLAADGPAAEFTATAGPYDLLAVARAGAATAGGLYSIEVVSTAGGTPIYRNTHPVGQLGPAEEVELPASAGYVLAIDDLGFPVPLGSLAAAVVRGVEVVAVARSAGGVAFNATSGVASLYALPVRATQTAAGAMAIEITQGSLPVLSTVEVASSPVTSSGASMLRAEVLWPADGMYRATLTDFAFPSALGDLQLGLFQSGRELGRRSGQGALDVTGRAGSAFLLVAARPGSAVGSGLYGVQMAPVTTGAVFYESTQAVGAVLDQRVVGVPSAGTYDVTVSDLEFPARFQELGVALTRGTQRVGFAFAGGEFAFDGEPGDYFLNVIARVDGEAQFGTYGILMATRPPEPTLTLSATPGAVRSGESARLTWSSTGATNCVASGQWTGNRATSGSESVGPLAAASTYTLNCTGPGGTVSKSATIAIRSSDGGGGSVDQFLSLLLLSLIAGLPVGRRPD